MNKGCMVVVAATLLNEFTKYKKIQHTDKDKSEKYLEYANNY